MTTGCAVSCIDFVDEMGSELVIPSRCVARASFEVDTSEGSGEDVWREITPRVLSAWAEGYSRGSLVRITRKSTATLTWPARDCALTSTSNLLISPRCVAA